MHKIVFAFWASFGEWHFFYRKLVGDWRHGSGFRQQPFRLAKSQKIISWKEKNHLTWVNRLYSMYHFSAPPLYFFCENPIPTHFIALCWVQCLEKKVGNGITSQPFQQWGGGKRTDVHNSDEIHEGRGREAYNPNP